jgi:NADPH2:quinone reductase
MAVHWAIERGEEMKAVRITEPGGPEAMRLEEVPTPLPQAGQVLVRVEAAGVNYIDTYQRSGQYKVPLPYTMGLEGAGTVEATGDGVTGIAKGARVAWTNVPGAYATHALVPADKVVPLPAGITSQQGAAVMLQGLTAHYLAHSTFPLRRGDACLVHAGAGGVGLLLTQMAKRAGARVFTTVSTDEKAALSKQAGADEVIRYTQDDFKDAVRRMTDGKGVRVVYDSVGRDTFEKSLDSLAPRGLLVLFGQSSGAVPPFDAQVLSAKGSLFLTRPTLAHYTATRDELLGRANEVFAWIADGSLKVRIGATFPLADAGRAHTELQGRRTTGKVLLLP